MVERRLPGPVADPAQVRHLGQVIEIVLRHVHDIHSQPGPGLPVERGALGHEVRVALTPFHLRQNLLLDPAHPPGDLIRRSRGVVRDHGLDPEPLQEPDVDPIHVTAHLADSAHPRRGQPVEVVLRYPVEHHEEGLSARLEDLDRAGDSGSVRVAHLAIRPVRGSGSASSDRRSGRRCAPARSRAC